MFICSNKSVVIKVRHHQWNALCLCDFVAELQVVSCWVVCWKLPFLTIVCIYDVWTQCKALDLVKSTRHTEVGCGGGQRIAWLTTLSFFFLFLKQAVAWCSKLHYASSNLKADFYELVVVFVFLCLCFSLSGWVMLLETQMWLSHSLLKETDTVPLCFKVIAG